MMIEIALENVTKKFVLDSGVVIPALIDINLVIEHGDLICIQGPSGSGKTTLLKIIYGILNVDSGVIKYSPNEIKNDIAYLPQNPELTKFLTIGENFLETQGTGECFDLLDPELLMSYPEEVSLGELQRAAQIKLAKLNPRVMLLDEPSANLDSKNIVKLIKFLKMKNEENITIVFTTHSDLLANIAKKRYILNGGQLKLL